jgi:hypothetical protein
MNKLEGPFFGLSKVEFTQEQIDKIAEYACKALAEYLKSPEYLHATTSKETTNE